MPCSSVIVPNPQFADVSALAGVAIAAVAVSRMQAIESLKRNLLSEANALRESSFDFSRIDLAEGGPAGDIIFVLADGQQATFTRDARGVFLPSNPAAVRLQKLILQQYAYRKYRKELESEGYSVVEESVDAQGTIRVIARRWRVRKEELAATIAANGEVAITHGDNTPWTDTMVESAEVIAVRLGEVQTHARDYRTAHAHTHPHTTQQVHQ